MPDVCARPTILDSWKSLGIEVRLSGKMAFRGDGVSLDSFDALEGTVDPETIGHAGLRAHVRAHKADYEQAASSCRRRLRGKGYLSAADARAVALQNLEKKGWADSLAHALAARFAELIVDEAQDCNPLDLALLNWLREYGLPVTVVCDPDQAIYGFRHGNPDPAQLHEFAARYTGDDRLKLTGNFRSSSIVCSTAATLRDRADPDDAMGENGEIGVPIQALMYGEAAVPLEVGRVFSDLTDALGINLDQTIILAHSRRAALQAAGLGPDSEQGGTSRVARVARAVGAFWSSSGSNTSRENALRDVERLILQLMGKIEDMEPVTKAVQRNEMDGRWLRRSALELITSLPKSCEDSDAGRAEWLATLHEAVRRLALDSDGIAETSFFRKPIAPDWSQSLQQGSTSGIRCATVHEAKGREYEAVCLVIPPNRAPLNHTEQLFNAWETRANDEAKRVAYVGITRAKKLVAIALPSAYQPRLEAILDGARVPWELHDLTGR